MLKKLLIILTIFCSACQGIDDNFPVPQASLVPNFSVEVVDASARRVRFKDLSIIPERINSVTYSWAFGDGSTSNEREPEYTFARYGEFSVKLVLVASQQGEIKESIQTFNLIQPINIDFTLYYKDVDNLLIKGVGESEINIATGGFGNGMALDTVNNKLFFVDDDNKLIQKVNLDGSNLETVVSGISGGQSIAVDPANNKIYWTSRANGTVNRANMDGTATEVIITGLSLPEGIAVFNGKVYVSDVDAPPMGEKIYRANVNGSSFEVFINGSWGYALAIDPINQRLYFDDQAVYDNAEDNRIKSVDLNNAADLITVGTLDAVTTNGSRCYGIAVRPIEGKVYWNDTRAKKIKRANLNGTGEETILIPEGSPRGLALGL